MVRSSKPPEQHDPEGDPCRRCGRVRQEHGTGNCFDAAIEQAQELAHNLTRYPAAVQTIFVCHGTATGQGPIAGLPIRHAWVEYGDIVIDASNGHNWSGRRERYYELGEIRDVRRYTYAEALKNLLRFQHYGPWDEDERGHDDGTP